MELLIVGRLVLRNVTNTIPFYQYAVKDIITTKSDMII